MIINHEEFGVYNNNLVKNYGLMFNSDYSVFSQTKFFNMKHPTVGHLRVTVGHPRVTIGNLRLTIGYLQASVVHIRITLGHLRLTIGYFFL